MSTLRGRIASWIAGHPVNLAAITARVDDSEGWGSLSNQPHDYRQDEIQTNYNDALTAWRKNPIAFRIIAITSDYTVGDKLAISSPRPQLNAFIQAFWNHPQNRMDQRLEQMSDELARAGDLFVVLFRNPEDGLSYLRLITKDQITRIETAENDWEQELLYEEQLPLGGTRQWLSPHNPAAADNTAVMLHYSVNKPAGALLGEGDLQTMIPWLQRYSRMLEDRVRLHWAARTFLWLITVPTEKIKEKVVKYATPPETGSVIVKDDSEVWEVTAPQLHGADAQHDLKAVRGMIDAGSGYPPHWRGEAADANLATAQAMQSPTERHLARRQKYFVWMLQDILYHSHQRAVQAGKQRPLSSNDYLALFTVTTPDVSRSDNEAMARAAKDLSAALTAMTTDLLGTSPTLTALTLRLLLRFAGEPQGEDVIARIIQEVKDNPRPRPTPPSKPDAAKEEPES